MEQREEIRQRAVKQWVGRKEKRIVKNQGVIEL